MRINLKDLSAKELVDLFARIGVAQNDAMREASSTKYNRLYQQMALIVDELKRRPGDQRRALVSLYNSENVQVRFAAATNTLAVSPDDARAQLEAIRRVKWLPQCGDAGMILRGLDSGSFKPK